MSLNTFTSTTPTGLSYGHSFIATDHASESLKAKLESQAVSDAYAKLTSGGVNNNMESQDELVQVILNLKMSSQPVQDAYDSLVNPKINKVERTPSLLELQSDLASRFPDSDATAIFAEVDAGIIPARQAERPRRQFSFDSTTTASSTFHWDEVLRRLSASSISSESLSSTSPKDSLFSEDSTSTWATSYGHRDSMIPAGQLVTSNNSSALTVESAAAPKSINIRRRIQAKLQRLSRASAQQQSTAPESIRSKVASVSSSYHSDKSKVASFSSKRSSSYLAPRCPASTEPQHSPVADSGRKLSPRVQELLKRMQGQSSAKSRRVIA